MKNILILAGFLVGGVGMGFGASAPTQVVTATERAAEAKASTDRAAERAAAEKVGEILRAMTDLELKKFDLDFPGGTPRDLVNAIQKAMGRPVNAVIPDEVRDTRLPPLRMNGVTTASLFRALESGSATERMVYHENGVSRMSSSYGFRTINPITDDSVWQFFARGMENSQQVSKYYALTPYLDNGLTVDDITTAIQTAWKMEGFREIPTLSYHRETKLLIVVGTYPAMSSVKGVLDALKPAVPAAPMDAALKAGAPAAAKK